MFTFNRSAKTGNRTENRTLDQPEIFKGGPVKNQSKIRGIGGRRISRSPSSSSVSLLRLGAKD